MFDLFPYQCTVDCGVWNGVGCRVWSVEEGEDNGALSGECSM